LSAIDWGNTRVETNTRAALRAAGLTLASPVIVRAQTMAPVKVMIFPGLANLPLFSAQPTGAFVRRGLRKLASVADVVGPYLGNAGWAMRDWARQNPDIVARYLAAYVQGIRWMLAPSNKDAVLAVLAERLRAAPPLAERNLALLTATGTGSAVDGRFGLEGFRNVLKIRAELPGSWGGTPPAPDRYLDLGYWERAGTAV